MLGELLDGLWFIFNQHAFDGSVLDSIDLLVNIDFCDNAHEVLLFEAVFNDGIGGFLIS